MYQVIPCKGVKTIQEMHKMKCLLKAVHLTVIVNLVSLIEKKKNLEILTNYLRTLTYTCKCHAGVYEQFQRKLNKHLKTTKTAYIFYIINV